MTVRGYFSLSKGQWLKGSNCFGPKKESHAKPRKRTEQGSPVFFFAFFFSRGAEPIRLSGIQIAIQDAKKKWKLPL